MTVEVYPIASAPESQENTGTINIADMQLEQRTALLRWAQAMKLPTDLGGVNHQESWVENNFTFYANGTVGPNSKDESLSVSESAAGIKFPSRLVVGILQMYRADDVMLPEDIQVGTLILPERDKDTNKFKVRPDYFEALEKQALELHVKGQIRQIAYDF